MSNDKRFVLLKDRAALEQYAAIVGMEQPKTMLEFEIFQGGSWALFPLWLGLDKFVGVDICDPALALDEFCRSHPVGKKICLHYGVSQTDGARIEHIIRSEFGSSLLEVIIDDASHRYRNSKTTFEIAFPLLRPGGLYVLEAWGWAHWRGMPVVERAYPGQTPLSMLMMELTMLCASRPELVSEIRVFPAFAFIRKSTSAPHLERFSLDDLYQKGALEIVGSRDLKIGGVCRLLCASAARSVARKLKWRRAQ